MADVINSINIIANIIENSANTVTISNSINITVELPFEP